MVGSITSLIGKQVAKGTAREFLSSVGHAVADLLFGGDADHASTETHGHGLAPGRAQIASELAQETSPYAKIAVQVEDNNILIEALNRSMLEQKNAIEKLSTLTQYKDDTGSSWWDWIKNTLLGGAGYFGTKAVAKSTAAIAEKKLEQIAAKEVAGEVTKEGVGQIVKKLGPK